MATNSSQYSSTQIRTQIKKALYGSKSAQALEQIEKALAEGEFGAFLRWCQRKG